MVWCITSYCKVDLSCLSKSVIAVHKHSQHISWQAGHAPALAGKLSTGNLLARTLVNMAQCTLGSFCKVSHSHENLRCFVFWCPPEFSGNMMQKPHSKGRYIAQMDDTLQLLAQACQCALPSLLSQHRASLLTALSRQPDSLHTLLDSAALCHLPPPQHCLPAAFTEASIRINRCCVSLQVDGTLKALTAAYACALPVVISQQRMSLLTASRPQPAHRDRVSSFVLWHGLPSAFAEATRTTIRCCVSSQVDGTLKALAAACQNVLPRLFSQQRASLLTAVRPQLDCLHTMVELAV